MSLSPSPDPGAARASASTAGALLRLSGADALALVHRLSTQAVDDLAPSQTRVTLFCDFRGRVLHRAAVARTRDGTVWMARDDGPGAELAVFLDRFVFRDDVRFEDTLGERSVRLAIGPGGPPAGTVEEGDGMPVRLQVEAESAWVIETPGAMRRNVGEQDRIRAAWPRHGHEVEESFNPFEIGRAHEVHLSKGCYTGQEALLRMVTYSGVRRALARVSGPGALPAAGAELLRDGTRVGRLTSAARDGEGWIGLAVLRSEALEDPRALETNTGAKVSAVTPVPATRPAGIP